MSKKKFLHKMTNLLLVTSLKIVGTGQKVSEGGTKLKPIQLGKYTPSNLDHRHQDGNMIS